MSANKIVDFLPSHMKISDTNPVTGERLLLPAIYKSIDEQSQKFSDLTVEAFRQLFLTTASGKYLIRLGAQEGFTVPQQSGLGVDAFRQIVPAVVSYPKQISDTIVRLMGIFYDKSLVSPSFISSVAEPFSFQDKDTLLIKTDKGLLSIGIYESQVADLTNVKATEYAGIINASQSDVFADTSYERESSKTYVRLTSKTYGAGAFIQIAGGTAQNVLRFPTTRATENTTGTTWTVEKKNLVPWTDIIKFTWDNVGNNPKVYLVQPGDFVTLKGLSDPFDVFSGTYTVEESGYDYFVIRNERFQPTSATLVEPAPNSILFTADKRSTIIQNKEYCVVTEADAYKYSMYVSAVPSAVKRKLRGGTFVHGWQAPIVDFTRTTMETRRKTMESMPIGDNRFVLSGTRLRYNAKKPFYKTNLGVDNAFSCSFLVDEISEGVSVFPYTSPYSPGIDNPIYGEIDSNCLTLHLNHKHGMYRGWGFTLAGMTEAGMLLSSEVNREQYVKICPNDYQIVFEINNGTKKFSGISWNGAPNVYQATSDILDYDAWMEFPSALAKQEAGFDYDMTFRFSYDGAALISGKEAIGSSLASKKCRVVDMDETRVYFLSGIGTGAKGQILAGASGVRSGFFGGTSGTWFLDKTSATNERMLSGLMATFQQTSPSVNPYYFGAYIYDPAGVDYGFVVGDILTKLTTPIYKGDNLLSIDVPNVDEFPLSGYLILEYGTDRQEGPIRYINVAVGQLIVDPSYVFQKAHGVDAQVQIVRSVEAIKLGIDGSQYPVYITGTTAARDFLFSLVRQIVAAGVFVSTEVNLPPLKYTDPSLFPYS